MPRVGTVIRDVMGVVYGWVLTILGRLGLGRGRRLGLGLNYS